MTDRAHRDIQATIAGRLVIVGFGSIGQGVLPLILRHIGVDRDRITIFTAHDRGRQIAQAGGISDFRVEPLTPETYRTQLGSVLREGDFLLNLSYDVSSVALIELCHQLDVGYLDSCIEPWIGGYFDPELTPSERSNYGLREIALAVNQKQWRHRPTCVLTHGVNPGLISHFTKRALARMARDLAIGKSAPRTGEDWARLAMDLGVRVIHVAERDFQQSALQKHPGEFVNTWSTEAFVGEGSQPAELGWGTHEKALPVDARQHPAGGQAAIYLERPGVSVRVRSWTPLEGPYHGFLITHGESISIASYLTLPEGGAVVYRPTVHYAYRPCDDAVMSIFEYCSKGYQLQPRSRLLREQVTGGVDELGILLCGNRKGVYWYGSRLSIDEARALAPHNNATTLQTAAGVLAGMIWAIENPGRGVVEPEAMDCDRIMQVAEPYLGTMVGVWDPWTPLQGRERLFPEDIDRDDPWQFKNILVT
jgi:homospermidine synthase